jgi:hypothetical protein
MHDHLSNNDFVRFSFPTAEKCELCLAVGTNLMAISTREHSQVRPFQLYDGGKM